MVINNRHKTCHLKRAKRSKQYKHEKSPMNKRIVITLMTRISAMCEWNTWQTYKANRSVVRVCAFSVQGSHIEAKGQTSKFVRTVTVIELWSDKFRNTVNTESLSRPLLLSHLHTHTYQVCYFLSLFIVLYY